jgi:DNA-binding transcriptional LysR family regulator
VAHPRGDRFLGVFEASSYTEALTLASLGIGAAIIPASYEKLNVTGVTFHKIAEPLPPAEVVMAWRDGGTPRSSGWGLELLWAVTIPVSVKPPPID